MSVHVQCIYRGKKRGSDSPGTGVFDASGPSCVCCEPNSDPVQKQ